MASREGDWDLALEGPELMDALEDLEKCNTVNSKEALSNYSLYKVQQKRLLEYID